MPPVYEHIDSKTIQDYAHLSEKSSQQTVSNDTMCKRCSSALARGRLLYAGLVHKLKV
jgi:hypothetical protein